MRCAGVICSRGTRTRRSRGTSTTVVEYGTRGLNRVYQSCTCRARAVGSIQPFQGTKGKRSFISPPVAGARHMSSNSAAEHPPAIAHPLSAPAEVHPTRSGRKRPRQHVPGARLIGAKHSARGEDQRTGHGGSPLVDVNGIRRRLAFAPVTIEVGDARQSGERAFVDPLTPGAGAGLLGEDGERSIADNLRGTPLGAVGHLPADGRLGLNDGARPKSVAGDVVALMLRRHAESDAS